VEECVSYFGQHKQRPLPACQDSKLAMSGEIGSMMKNS
jgi:hypothetical protein